MRIKIVLTGPSYAQTANIPCEGTDTVEQLKQKLKKRIPQVPAEIELIFDGGRLFDEDTLESLGIKEGDSIIEDNGNAGAPPPTSVDVTVGQLTIQDTLPTPSSATPEGKVADVDNNNNATTDNEKKVSAPIDANEGAAAILITNPGREITEVLEVVFDISASMDAHFVDGLSRLSSSKVCFGAFIDKTLAFEYPHAVGLICFGQNIYDTLPITRQLNSFETVFGNIIKTEGSTNLYPAVDLAVKRLKTYAATLPAGVKKRIMCFTDGGDNSGWSAFDVARTVLDEQIVVDAIIVGGTDSDHVNLRSLAHCSGGISVRIPEQEASISSVFEREQILTLSARVARAQITKDQLVQSSGMFKSFGDLNLYPYVGVDLKEVTSAPRPTTVSKAADLATLQALASQPTPVSSSPSSVSSSSPPTRGAGAMKRLLKEFQESQSCGYEIFLTDNDIGEWKILLHGRVGTSYEGGIWVVSFSFPSDYPFKPPKVLFLTPIYHCNISDQGRVCIDILQNSWSPALTVSRIMGSLDALLADPNVDDALDAWKASLARTDRKQYEANIKDHTKSSACSSKQDACSRYNLSS